MLSSWGSCRSIPQAIPVAAPPNSIQLLRLTAFDLSEDRSQLSTKEDEIYLFSFWTRGQQIIQQEQSMLFRFRPKENVHQLMNTFTGLKLQDQLHFFLIELDNDTLSSTITNQLAQWVVAEDFSLSFDQLDADTALGDDDLLGMHTIMIKDKWPVSPLVFEGMQLFDRFRYELEFSGR